ncbi:MAG: hypothetical protein K0S25_823 [Bacillus sp. (in: firmicutes)]|nr:hypothetical protein [Sphingobacterium sp.]MDF2535433.1 hypothetical protein [Bacillales bacterium]MDF2903185.1 hypothetical protein [Bacillus sp. (in: firmicutes)]
MPINFEKLLSQKEYLNNVTSENEYKYTFDFIMRDGRSVPLIIFFDDFYPANLPFVSINEKTHIIPRIPHVLKSGTICFLDKEGIVWSDNPEDVLDFIFDRVENVLLENTPLLEFHKEFSYYFGSLTKIEVTWSMVSLGDEPEEISLVSTKNGPLLFLKRNEQSESFFKKQLNRNLSSQNLNKALYIPLE